MGPDAALGGQPRDGPQADGDDRAYQPSRRLADDPGSHPGSTHHRRPDRARRVRTRGRRADSRSPPSSSARARTPTAGSMPAGCSTSRSSSPDVARRRASIACWPLFCSPTSSVPPSGCRSWGTIAGARSSRSTTALCALAWRAGAARRSRPSATALWPPSTDRPARSAAPPRSWRGS